MGRLFFCRLLTVGLLLFGVVQAAQGVITALTPLGAYLSQSSYIILAKVEKFYPEKPAMMLTVEEDLKGKIPLRRLPVNVKLDPKAEKGNYVPEILKRIGPNQKIVLFVLSLEESLMVLGFSNGSWFQMSGQKVDEGKSVFTLTSGEPFLRRTFKGTTGEMRQLVKDCLAGKKKPPEPDAKEKSGFGPEVSAPKEKSSGITPWRAGGVSPPVTSSHPGHYHPGANAPRSLFGVIPTLGVGAPLAILALLFPTVFGGVLILFRQWLAFITVLSINSTLYVIYLLFGDHLREWWLGTFAGLWFVMTLVALWGTLLAWNRQLYNLSLGAGALETPRKTESIVLWILTACCGGFSVVTWLFSNRYDMADYLLFVFTLGMVVATAYHVYRGIFCENSLVPGRSTEGVLLSTILLAHLGVAIIFWGSGGVAGSAEAGKIAPGERVAELVGLRWEFQSPQDGLFVSSPLPHGDRIYAASAHTVFKFGQLYCLDRHSGKKIWTFTDRGAFKEMISSPTLSDGKLYIGEGFHDDPRCKLYCIDAATGKKIWDFQTNSQTEAGPIVAAGRVYSGAGNDGFYCLDAVTGKVLWQFPAEPTKGRLLRFGASAAIAADHVFVGTGVDRNRTEDPGETALFCFHALTGEQIWKTPVDLPCWGAPVPFGDHVFFGVGNGDIFTDAAKPTGALVCLDAKSGAMVWRVNVPNGILDRPAIDEASVYFGCRDGNVYCLDRTDGTECWRRSLDSPVIAAPALAQWAGQTDSVFAVATKGKVCCLDPKSGAIHWTYNLTSRKAHLSSAPKVVVTRTSEGDRRHLYFGAGLGDIASGKAVVYCLEDRLKEK